MPTLVQNPPTANDVVNPTRLKLPVIKLNKIGLAVDKPKSFWVAGYPTQLKSGEEKEEKKEKKGKKKLPCPGIELTEFCPFRLLYLSIALSIELWCRADNLTNFNHTNTDGPRNS